ncbi:hypothetical protein GmHk_12G035237 [Glycine max]|nr:hypothetical protein GmHk_12G035237 [Glycine max]
MVGAVKCVIIAMPATCLSNGFVDNQDIEENLDNDVTNSSNESQTCSASGYERNWSIFEHIHSKRRNRLEHQKLDDLVLEESPPFLTREEVEALCNNLANMSIQSTLDDIDMFLKNINKLNLDEYEDDDVPQPPDNTMEDVNPNESNIDEKYHSFDEEGLPEVDPTLTPSI